MTANSMPRRNISLCCWLVLSLGCLARLIALGLFMGSLLVGCAGLSKPPDTGGRWLPLAPHLWWLPGVVASSDPENLGDTSNHLFVQVSTGGQAQGWLIGSGASPALGARLRASLQTQLGLQVTDIIAARAHPESVLGAVAFPEARFWALPVVANAMAQRCPTCQDNLRHQTADVSLQPDRIRLPTEVIAVAPVSGAALPHRATLGPFDAWAVQRSASDWTTLLHHRDSGYWFSPGLVWGRGVLPELREANASVLLSTLNAWQDKWQGEWQVRGESTQRLVPEQGEPGDATLLLANRAYWQALLDECGAAQARGDGELDFIALATPTAQASFDPTPLNTLRQSLNRQRVWREMEFR